MNMGCISTKRNKLTLCISLFLFNINVLNCKLYDSCNVPYMWFQYLKH